MVFPALREEPTVTVKLFSAGIAACVADVITFPLDVAKVRLQIQGEVLLHQSCNKTVHKGMFAMLTHIASHEGPKSLYNGLCAGLQRQMCFASIRIGLYDSVKNYYNSVLGSSGAVESNIGIRILAGVTTGGLSVVFAQPTDVVKVRMQAQVSGTSQRYAGTISAYKTISVEEGIKGLWKGTLPNIARNAIVNAAELVCYDCIKDLILRKGYMSDNVPCHFSSAFAAGFCATVVASPVDVVKTRFMNSRTGQYSGALDCACKMFREGGISAFYKGFFPSFIRLGSWNICMFVTYEQLKRLLSSEKPRTVPAYDWANMYALATYVRCSSLHKSRFYPKAINQWE